MSRLDDTAYGALFDLDGVIIDSETSYAKIWTEVERLYPTGIPDFAYYIKGTTLPEIMKHFKDPSTHEDIIRRLFAYQETMEFPIYPGVEDFLAELNRRGIPTAIVTSSDKHKMNLLFRQHPELRDYFTTIIDASQVTRSKPDPQGYLLAAQAIGRRPERCVVFEDSIQGMRAGKASGAKTVGVATTYPLDKVRAEHPDKVVAGLWEITADSMLALFD